ncbi:hypothetical protein LZ32DRAFT_659212 [Colletotrichum eremochloae]|nr:hypothetical protein LZ32DRAFT_659212 [Colletotrichum eremochloae]
MDWRSETGSRLNSRRSFMAHTATQTPASTTREKEGAFSVIVAGAYKDLDVDSGTSILYSGSNAHEKFTSLDEEQLKGKSGASSRAERIMSSYKRHHRSFTPSITFTGALKLHDAIFADTKSVSRRIAGNKN